MEKSCENCKHALKRAGKEPCISCNNSSIDFNDFEPIEQFDAVKQVKHYQLFGGDKQVYDLIRDRLDALVDSKHTKDLTQAQQLEVAAWYKDVIKYTMRWMGKDGIQDLKKTKEYIDKILEVYES